MQAKARWSSAAAAWVRAVACRQAGRQAGMHACMRAARQKEVLFCSPSSSSKKIELAAKLAGFRRRSFLLLGRDGDDPPAHAVDQPVSQPDMAVIQ